MDKKSAADFSQVISDSAVALRSVAEERDFYMQKCASLERRRDAEKMATAAHEKGAYIEYEPEELADHFEKEAAAGKLPEIGRALDMIAPNMGMKLASVSDERVVGSGTTDFERYLHGEIG